MLLVRLLLLLLLRSSEQAVRNGDATVFISPVLSPSPLLQAPSLHLIYGWEHQLSLCLAPGRSTRLALLPAVALPACRATTNYGSASARPPLSPPLPGACWWWHGRWWLVVIIQKGGEATPRFHFPEGVRMSRSNSQENPVGRGARPTSRENESRSMFHSALYWPDRLGDIGLPGVDGVQGRGHGACAGARDMFYIARVPAPNAALSSPSPETQRLCFRFYQTWPDTSSSSSPQARPCARAVPPPPPSRRPA